MTALSFDVDHDELRSSFRGTLLLRGQPGYDEARAVFNAMVDRHPAVVAQCTGVADVRAALAFARAHEMAIAVRGGGHSVPGYGVCDDGMVLDLRPMQGIRVDPQARIARVQAGATWGQLDRETQEFGLAVPGGRISTTGVIGLTIGSGSGWLERSFGLTPDNLISADVVLADGSFVTASATEHPDLFWALRGGGGNFGVVTEIALQLHPVGPIVHGGMLVWPAADAPRVLRGYRELVASAPDQLGGGIGFLTAPPEPFVPPELVGTPVVAVIVCTIGDLDAAEDLLAPMRALEPALDLVQPMPYVAVQQLVDGGNTAGARNYWKAEFLDELTDDVIDVFCRSAAARPSPESAVLVFPMGGALARALPGSSPLGNRDAGWSYHAIGRWHDPADDEANIAWARELNQATAPFTRPGVYLNFVGDEGLDRVRSTYGDALERLQAAKAAYDPDNVFRMNQNIPPA